MLAKTNTILNNRRLLLIGVVMLLILGLFFRVYNFQAWLHFGNDQTRDAFLIENVVKNNAPWPLIGSSMGNTGFLLGPAYYYFQIISVKLFGIGPEKLAYPDLLFNLLAIPLLYFLLKRFFSKNLALSLTGLYGLSYYAIEYSRFAWNPNPIPFFVMLFLLSLWEFLISAEKTKWHWVILLGIATGIGSQLHAILLLVMVGVLGVVFIFLMKKSWRTWSRWLLIFLIVIIANAGQIIYEKQNNFKNSRLFLASFADKSGNGGNKRFFRNLQLNVACNAQANSHIISSLGNKENCDFLYSKARNVRPGAKLQLPNNPLSLLAILVSLCFSVFGYATLAVGIKNEKDKKRKYFAGIILLYAAISFAVMLPIIDQAPLRYFIHLTFLPFIFLGLLAETLKNKVGQKY
ncbi:MAG: glycosyltransferase family 39 protein, partial [Candidatus Moraniibacteriota bacterium]